MDDKKDNEVEDVEDSIEPSQHQIDSIIRLYWFINPITVIVAITLTIMYCGSHFESCYSPCQYGVDLGGKYDMYVAGSTKTPDGEVCTIEQVDYVYYEMNTPNREKQCLDVGEGRRKPMVRRIVCPSGKNGQSGVGTDGTKFQREIIQ